MWELPGTTALGRVDSAIKFNRTTCLREKKKIQAFPGLVLEVCVSKDSIQNSFEIAWKEHLQSPHNFTQNAIFLYW